jgi:glutaminase
VLSIQEIERLHLARSRDNFQGKPSEMAAARFKQYCNMICCNRKLSLAGMRIASESATVIARFLVTNNNIAKLILSQN